MKLKIAAGIIVFNSDFVLKQVLESIYPYMNQILISEGCVSYWKDKGFTTSKDKTNEILKNFPDPQHKIKIVHGTYLEKTEQANAYMQHVAPDTDYIWNIDADEVFKANDIESIINILATERPTSMGFKAYSFYGGFENYLTGFDHDHEFIRIQKYPYWGAQWVNHRPPTLELPAGESKKHISSEQLAAQGIYMYHYSYTFPRQVFEKVQYYEGAVIAPGKCIPDYFNSVYLPWVMGTAEQKQAIEQKYQGVHEFTPDARGDCYTTRFVGCHPFPIIKAMKELKKEFEAQLTPFLLERTFQ